MGTDEYMDLEESLKINGPHKLAEAPNAYSFSRRRDISADETFWLDILSEIGLNSEEIDRRRRIQIKRSFQSAWGVDDGGTVTDTIIADNLFSLTADWPAQIHDPTTVYKTSLGAAVDQKFFVFNRPPSAWRTPPYAMAASSVTEGCVLRFPPGQIGARWYQPLIFDGANGQRPARADEITAARWDDFWDTVTELVSVSFEPLLDSVDPAAKPVLAEKIIKQATTSFSAVDIIRADAAVIEQQYLYLQNEFRLAETLSSKADALLADMVTGAAPASLTSLIAHYKELGSHLPRVTRLRQQLVDAAADLGYRLFLDDTKVKYTDEAGNDVEETIKAGMLYLESQKTVTWVTYQTVTETRRSLFRKRTVTYTVPIENRKTFTYYQKANVDYDPWVEVAEAYRKHGHNVFLFKETATGLATADGTTIDSVMSRCRTDESFRTTCTLGMPFYEDTIAGERLLVGYVLLVRPLPEIVPNMMPALHIEEQLTYKFAWQGVALGELAATIPLAPSEERTVTLSVSQRFEASRSVSTSSLSEITRVDKSDFESVFEKEVRREKETTQTAGGSIGGSYGPVSGSANFSTTTTTKDMSRQLNRSVQRASQELTRRSKEETTVTITEKTETNTSTATTYKISNINQGRTLNINLYRLVNTFKSNLFLNDFDFYIEAGPEIISGTGLRSGRSFSRSRIDALWSYLLEAGVMPIDLTDKADVFKIALCKVIAERLEAEYSDDDAQAYDEQTLQLQTFVAEKGFQDVLRTLQAGVGMPISMLPRLLSTAVGGAGVNQHELSSVQSELLVRTFCTLNCDFSGLLNRPFLETSFAYDSGGLHADAQVGLRPATEEYSEQMRKLEREAKIADTRLVGARANYLNARATKALIGLDQIIDPAKVYVTDRSTLYEADGHPSLTLRLSHVILPDEGWFVDIKDGGRFPQNAGSTPVGLVFRLPRQFAIAPWDIAGRDGAWFTANVNLVHPVLALKLKYR